MDKNELNKKTVEQLQRLAKKHGAKTETPDGKRKNKAQLVNSVLMAYRLNGKKGLADKTSPKPKKAIGKYAIATTNGVKYIIWKHNSAGLRGASHGSMVNSFAEYLKGLGYVKVSKSDF